MLDSHTTTDGPTSTGSNPLLKPESPSLRPVLERYFGFPAFRPLQEEIIRDALAGRDVLAVLPTGGGKSLCFQLPAVVRPGLAVVVSPLIALMKDQVDSLTTAGIPATFLSSTLDAAEARERLRGLAEGRYRLLYVAPERLLLPGFMASLRGMNVSSIAVDEAHCISQWGHDFRPEYRRIADLREIFPRAPVMALSATATERVRADIVASLRLRDPRRYVASFNRPNLLYRVEPKDGALDRIVTLARRHAGEAGIVYAQSRRAVELLAERLRREHVNAAPYHAGLDADVRARTQDAFSRDDVRVICATIAFGMGVHKPNVRFVVHHDLPGDIESYYQETGRAGRDGLPAECLLLYNPGDAVKQAHFIDEKVDPDERARARSKLGEMLSFAESGACRRRTLLAYFGEEPPEGPCGGCDNCLSPPERYDGTIEAQKLLSCVLRIQQRSQVSVGLGHVINVLCGADSAKIRRMGHTDLSTYGIGKEHSRAEWAAVGRELLRLGLMRLSGDRYPVLDVTPEGRSILSRRERVTLTRPPVPARPLVRAPSAGGGAAEPPVDEALFEALRALRRSLARERDVPPYVLFSDASLRQMAALRPTDLDGFRRVHGVGEKKLFDLGPVFLETIRRHVAANEAPSSQARRGDTESAEASRRSCA